MRQGFQSLPEEAAVLQSSAYSFYKTFRRPVRPSLVEGLQSHFVEFCRLLSNAHLRETVSHRLGVSFIVIGDWSHFHWLVKIHQLFSVSTTLESSICTIPTRTDVDTKTYRKVLLMLDAPLPSAAFSICLRAIRWCLFEHDLRFSDTFCLRLLRRLCVIACDISLVCKHYS